MKLGSGTLKHTRPRDAMRAAAALSHRNPGTGEPGPQTSLEGAGGGPGAAAPSSCPGLCGCKGEGASQPTPLAPLAAFAALPEDAPAPG